MKEGNNMIYYANENSPCIQHYGVLGMRWGHRKSHGSSNNRKLQKNRIKAKKQYQKHLKKNNGEINNVKRYQDLPVSKATKNKPYSDHYVFDRKRKTIVKKYVINTMGQILQKDISNNDYKKGEKLVKRLTNDWYTNIKYKRYLED